MTTGEVVQKSTRPAKSRRYMSRYAVPSVLVIPSGRSVDEVGRLLARALIDSDALELTRTEGRYVVALGDASNPAAELPLALNEALDNEYEARALWAVVRLYPRERGRVRVLLRRISPRHGFLSTYQNEGCRCEACTAANAAATLAYRRRRNPPKEAKERKHGAQCWRYGCYCDERRAADRLRQQRRRERLALMKSGTGLGSNGVPDKSRPEVDDDHDPHPPGVSSA